MNNFTFTPTDSLNDLILRVPFIEDARADFAPFYSTSKTVDTLQNEVVTEVAKLGGGGVLFREGFFGEKPKRYGYLISFNMNGQPARMVAAGLPIRSETPAKREQVKKQALANVREWLKAAVTARVFSPGANPLVQFLLVDGERTLIEALFDGNQLRLPQPAKAQADDAVEGVVVDGQP